MQAQGFEQAIGEHSDTIVFALAIADDDLVVSKVQIFDTQPQDFHQAQAGAVHDLGKQAENAIQPVDHFFGFLFGQDGRNVFRFLRANGADNGLIQLHIQDVAIEKEDGAEGLILSGGSYFSLQGEVGNEGVDFPGAHAERVFFVVKEDKATNPGQVGVFSTE